jgi:Ca-activated chloride channel family protein
MKVVAVMLLAVSLSSLGKFWQPSNSNAANRRGVASYEAKKYGEAAQAFARAHQLAPNSTTAFNLGTAQIAAGEREQGTATLNTALQDRSIRADALYNRGNSALAANELDSAIRDYSEALKLHPRDAQAKRNLEIALTKRKNSSQRGGAKGPQQQGNQSPQQQPQSPSGGEQPKQQAPSRGDADRESLLRSVQQQEQEEMRRMKKPSRSTVRVGW